MALLRRKPAPVDDVMAGFGYKTGWAAFEDARTGDVFDLLGLTDRRESRWSEGVDLSYEREPGVVAVTPRLPGAGGDWVLATGRALATAEPEPDIAAWSRALNTEVQYFFTHRVSEVHQWVRARDGRVVRSFCHAGDTGEMVSNEGKPDPIEVSVGFPERELTEDEMFEAMLAIDEESVMQVAAGWSLSPVELDGRSAPGPLTLGRWRRPIHG